MVPRPKPIKPQTAQKPLKRPYESISKYSKAAPEADIEPTATLTLEEPKAQQESEHNCCNGNNNITNPQAILSSLLQNMSKSPSLLPFNRNYGFKVDSVFQDPFTAAMNHMIQGSLSSDWSTSMRNDPFATRLFSRRPNQFDPAAFTDMADTYSGLFANGHGHLMSAMVSSGFGMLSKNFGNTTGGFKAPWPEHTILDLELDNYFPTVPTGQFRTRLEFQKAMNSTFPMTLLTGAGAPGQIRTAETVTQKPGLSSTSASSNTSEQNSTVLKDGFFFSTKYEQPIETCTASCTDSSNSTNAASNENREGMFTEYFGTGPDPKITSKNGRGRSRGTCSRGKCCRGRDKMRSKTGTKTSHSHSTRRVNSARPVSHRRPLASTSSRSDMNRRPQSGGHRRTSRRSNSNRNKRRSPSSGSDSESDVSSSRGGRRSVRQRQQR